MSNTADNGANIHLVFSRPPEGVSEEEFEAWCEAHLDEIVKIPGFISAKLFRLDPWMSDPDIQIPQRLMALYEFEGGEEQAMAGIASMRDTGGMDLPEWFEAFMTQSCIISWNCIALTPRYERAA
jgi:hypothetical protein